MQNSYTRRSFFKKLAVTGSAATLATGSSTAGKSAEVSATKPLRLMVATDWANYNLYTVTGLTTDTWTLVSVDLTAPTTAIGTVDFNSIILIRFDYEVQFTAANIKIDLLRRV